MAAPKIFAEVVRGPGGAEDVAAAVVAAARERSGVASWLARRRSIDGDPRRAAVGVLFLCHDGANLRRQRSIQTALA